MALRFPATGLIQPWELRGMRLTGDFRAAAVMTVNNIEAAIRLSVAGMGIAYVPDFVVREAMDEGQLQEVLPGCCVKDGHFSVLWPASRYLSPRIRCFIDFIAAAEIPLSPASASPTTEKLSAGYPAARPAKAGGRYTSQGSILPFGKIGLDPLLQIILGADGRVLPLRPEDLDIFIGLAEKRQAVARP